MKKLFNLFNNKKKNLRELHRINISLIKYSKYFDEVWYLNQYPEVASLNISPAEHYLTKGFLELKNPSDKFNTRFYLDSYSDIKQANVNPLLHYIQFGEKEGRKISNNSLQIIHNDIDINEKFMIEKLAYQKKNLQNKNIFRNSKNLVIIGELSLPQCLKYRVLQKKEAFQRLGYSVEISSQNDYFRVKKLLSCASIVIFYRIKFDNNFFEYVRECLNFNIPIGYDIDDPMYDKDLLLTNKNMNYIDLSTFKSILDDSDYILKAINLCDFMIVSTPGMKTNLMQKHKIKNVFIRRNLVDEETKTYSKQILRTKKENSTKIIKIIYATPSKAHNADLYFIKDVLIKVLQENKGKVRLVLMGDLDLIDDFNVVKKYIDIEPAKDYKGFLKTLSTMDINIVPLLDNQFNDCKSNIKFLDASMVEVASVCSYVGEYKENLTDGKHCFLAKNLEEWYLKLTTLINDKELRIKIAKDAKNHAESFFDYNNLTNEIKQIERLENE